MRSQKHLFSAVSPLFAFAEPLERRMLLSAETFDVTNTLDSGEGSFRQAIIDANAVPTADTPEIVFQFPGSGTHIIQPRSSLPFITADVDIMALPDGSINEPPNIEIDGELAGANAVGLFIERDTPNNSNESEVQGLIINDFGKQGMDIQGDAPTMIQNCRIGTDAAGATTAANGDDGILVEAPDCTIALCTVSGNDGDGIDFAAGADNGIVGACQIGTSAGGTKALANQGWGIESAAASTKVIEDVVSGNATGGVSDTSTDFVLEASSIGMNVANTVAIPNRGPGISLQNADNSQVGSTDTVFLDISGGNVISGNDGVGVKVVNSPGAVIFGNKIGTNGDGTAAVPNTGGGVNILGNNDLVNQNLISGNGISGVAIGEINQNNSSTDSITYNKIGTSSNGKKAIPNGGDGVVLEDADHTRINNNVIAYNDINGPEGLDIGNGVDVLENDSVSNVITDNSIFSNEKLGIALGDDDTPLPNHTGTATGPNDDQNYPVLTGASVNGHSITVTGTLDAEEDTSYYIQLFVSGSADTSGFGEGQVVLDSVNVMTNDGAHATFQDTITYDPGFLATDVITATATKLTGSTGAFVLDETSEFSKAIGLKGASVQGMVFNDANGDGVKGKTEKGLAGRTVYADLNHDDVMESTEPSTTTDANGNYDLFGLAAGKYLIRLAHTAGYTQTRPSVDYQRATVVTGKATLAAAFGQRRNTPKVTPTYAINAGSPTPYIDTLGQIWSGDTDFDTGLGDPSIVPVSGTADSPLFASRRFTPTGMNSFTYTLPVKNGKYTVKLLFQDPTSTAANQRYVKVLAQGVTVIKKLDIFALVGQSAALTESFSVTVSTRSLVLEFERYRGDSLVSGIEVLPA